MFFRSRQLQQIAADAAATRAEVQALLTQGKLIMSALDNLKSAVAAQTSVDQSAVALIQGLAGQIAALASNKNDADLQALADELTAAASPLASAVTANTAPAPAASAGQDTVTGS